MRFLLAILLTAIPLAAAAVTDVDLARRVDAYIAPLAATHDFNGVVLIARGDKVLVRKAYGLADWELNVPMSGRARFRVASITKTFTAAAISMLAERGELAYTDPLSKFIPDFPSGEKITIRQLLGHTSGVADPDSSCAEVTLDDLVKQIAAKPLAFEPGTKSRLQQRRLHTAGARHRGCFRTDLAGLSGERDFRAACPLRDDRGPQGSNYVDASARLRSGTGTGRASERSL